MFGTIKFQQFYMRLSGTIRRGLIFFILLCRFPLLSVLSQRALTVKTKNRTHCSVIEKRTNFHLKIVLFQFQFFFFFNYFFVSGDKFIEGDNLTCAFKEMQINFSFGTMKGPLKTFQAKGVFDNRFQVRLVTLPTNLLGSHLY